METAPLSRRERNKESTRAALHEAALCLTEERGLSGVTLDAITERADVAPRTFSNYFACKEDAVLGYDPCAADLLSQALAARPPDEAPLDALKTVLIEHLTARFHPLEAALRRSRVIRSEPHLKARMAGQFDELTTGLIKVTASRLGVDPEVDLRPTLIVSASANASRSAMLWWGARQPGPALEEVLRQTFDQLAQGFANVHPEPASRRLPKPRTKDL